MEENAEYSGNQQIKISSWTRIADGNTAGFSSRLGRQSIEFSRLFLLHAALHEYESRSFGESLKILQKKTIPPRSGQILGRKTSNDLKQIITRIFTRFGFAPIFKGALSSASPFCYIVSLENLRFVIHASNEVQCCLRYIIVS